jgi:hypothetical protein
MLKSSKFEPTLSEADRAAARALLQAIEPFRQLNPSMPLSYVTAFLLVASEEGKGVAEYAEAASTPGIDPVSPTVMTRNLLDIGDRNRQREEGFGLITQERDIFDLRKHNAKITQKGKAFMNAIRRAWGH